MSHTFSMMLFRLLLLFWNTIAAGGFLIVVDSSSSVGYFHHRSIQRDGVDDSSLSEDAIITLPSDIACDVRLITEQLSRNAKSLDAVMIIDYDNITAQDDETSGTISCHKDYQGEMPLPSSIPYSERFSYFIQAANKGDPRAQHSVGLLLWNGFASSSTEEDAATIDPAASARWHAAAAIQGNLDALAVFGGCLRTGKGVGKCKNIALGLRCIEFAASVGNPSGVNKKAALMEANDDYLTAMKLYRECYDDESKRINALLLFNLGYCLIHGEGIDHNIEEGEQLWKDSVELAPEEGSEESAWFLYQQYSERRDSNMAKRYLNIAADLGLEDAVDERRKIS